SLAILGALEPSVDADGLRRGNAAVIDFLDYLQGLVAERRQRPSQDRDDVLSRLILEADRGESGRNGETAEPLDNRVLLHNCIFILNAGHETTTNLIGNGIKLLLDIDGLATRLRAEPTLLPGAVEEMLRLQSPNQLGNRMVVRPVHVGGELLAPGTPVTLCIGAANRDPAVFAEPDRFLAERDPNPHLAFGHGPHLCAGLAVARMEARIALGRLLARFPVLRADGPPRLAGRVRFRGYRNLPLRVD
ncbi:MAG: cytochrome P450, partial [Gammaproteobacteria bacterium]|nr:cytochrome P450 [Gammaproteobacteria bacterium]